MDFSIYKDFSDFLQSLTKSPGYSGKIIAVNFMKDGSEIEILGHKPRKVDKRVNKNSFKLRGFSDANEFILFHKFNDLMVIQSVKDVIEKGLYFFMIKHFEALTLTDEITGFNNQRALKKDLQEHIDKTTPFQILFMDVDNFKSVNDQHGHITGSFVLKELAITISSKIKNKGVLYRYGGDEFVVIIPNMGSTECLKLGQDIRESVANRVFVANKKKLNFTISIGISEYPVHAKTLDEIITIADHMMYASKKAGKNSVKHAKDLLGK